jgi:hypothetical protein
MSRTLFAALLACLLPASAQAHFLFVRILPPAEGGRFAEVYFSESATAGDPQFVDKIAGTELWLQTAPGKFEPLKVHKTDDRLRTLLPSSNNLMIVGSCTYGVLARKTPFLLRHFPKAMAGDPDQLKQMKPFAKVPLEIVGVPDGDGIHFTALRGGKPMPGVEFNTIASDLSGVKFKADEQGSATWKPSKPGYYSVFVSHFSKSAGTFGEAKYEEIRDFATLSFTWPVVPDERKPATRKLTK